MNKPTIGIIGNGFVGEAQAFAFSPVSYIKIYDIDPLKSTHTLKQTHDSDFVFVAGGAINLMEILRFSPRSRGPVQCTFSNQILDVNSLGLKHRDEFFDNFVIKNLVIIFQRKRKAKG